MDQDKVKKFKAIELFKKLSLALASIAILFAILELLARLFNLSPVVLDFFILNPQTCCYETNTKVYSNFRDQSFLKEKGAHTSRIFVFGGSSIYHLGDFPLLKDLLAKEFPSRRFEIINVGGGSYGTSRLIPIIKETIKYNPDLFIIYCGHNEFLERFIRENAGIKFVQHLHKRLLRIRGYVFLLKAVNKLGTKLNIPKITLPNTRVRILWARPWSEAERAKIYQRYASNIIEIVNFAKGKAIDIIISTVAYNYLDDRYISPSYYSSKHKKNTQHSRNQIEIQSLPDEKIFEFANKLENDPYIENRLGRYYLKRQDYDKAKEHFINAARVDFQPFRANAITNGIIRKISDELNVPLADVEGIIIQHSNHMIPDYDLFSDWCHLNEEGNRLLQLAFFNVIKKSNKLNSDAGVINK